MTLTLPTPAVLIYSARFPRLVVVLGKPYTVTLVNKPGDVPHSGRGSLHGEVDTYERSIRVLWKDHMPADRLHTLLHELIHAVAFEVSLSAAEAGDWEEEVNRLASGLVDMLWRNAWLAELFEIPLPMATPEVYEPNLMGRVYRVEWYEDAEEVEPDTGEEMTAWIGTTTKVIRLFWADNLFNRRFTLVRECIRCLTYELRLGAFVDRAHELSLMCGALADTLLRNGWLVDLWPEVTHS